MSSDPLLSIANVALTDAQLRRRIAKFVSDVLDEAEYLLENGNMKVRADLTGKLIPHLVRQMSEQAEDASLAKMREEMAELMAEMRSIGPAPAPEPPVIDIPVDTPDAPDADPA